MKSIRHGIVVLAACVFIPVSTASAQVRFELGFGWIFGFPAMNDTYENEFVPPFTPAPSYDGSAASQTLHIDAGTSYGMTGFFNMMFTPHVGLQLMADYFKPALRGANSDYELSLDYRTVADAARHYEDSVSWPATDGNLTEITYCLNGLIRFPIPGPFDAGISGGVSLFNLKGKAIPMGFTKFWRDAEDTLYINTFRMVYEFGSKTQYGFNVGGEVSYNLFRLLVVSAEVRHFHGAAKDYQMRIADDDVLDDPPAVIEGILDLGSLRVNPSYTRLNIALRVQF
jgi:hypothetical protein